MSREDVTVARTGLLVDDTVLVDHLLAAGLLDEDRGLLIVGPEAERHGLWHFLERLSVSTSDPVFTVLRGRTETGTVEPLAMTKKVAGPASWYPPVGTGTLRRFDWVRRAGVAQAQPDRRAGAVGRGERGSSDTELALQVI